MTGRNSAKIRRTLPVLEGLEDRKLLSPPTLAPGGKIINNQDLAHYQLQKANGVPLADRRIIYNTPQGTKVTVTLLGFGSLAGSTVRPDGTLDVVYSKTLNTSKIIGNVIGGTHRATIGSIRDAAVAPGSPTATGSEPVNVVNFKHFDLVAGGYINLEGGVGTLALASAGPNTQIHLGLLPASAASSASSTTQQQTILQNNTGSVVSTTGQAVTTTSTTSTTNATPTGAEVSIPIVNAAPRAVPIGDAQIFGFDPTAGTVVRFDAVTGAALQTIPVPINGTPLAGTGLGRDNGRQVVLVGSGTMISVFDVVTGAPVGQFTTANLGASGLNEVDGIGSSDTRTFVSDSKVGLIQSLDVTASLATGQAVPIGIPFAPQREFELSGGLTGLAGSDVIYATGGAHFDTFVPDRLQVGILAFTPSVIFGARETSRVAVPGILTSTIDAGPPGSLRQNPTAALGSIAGNLALVSGVFNGTNVVTMYTPSSTALTPNGTVNLKDPNRLAGLSESFHPELLNGALIDVTGPLRRFVGQQATGLVIHASSTINLVQIGSATDTAVVGNPLNHVDIPIRNNVALISSARGPKGTGTKGGVVVVSSTTKPIGVLTLP
jgi:hypothetical protein